MRSKLLLVLLVTAATLAAVLWGVDLDEARRALARAEPWVLVPLVLLYVLAAVLRTARLQLLLHRPLPFAPTYAVVAVSFLAVNVLPLRMGELVRPYLLAERQGVPVGAGLAAVVLERVLDLIGLLVLLAVAAATLPDRQVLVAGVDVLAVGRATITTAVAVGVVGVALIVVIGDPMVRALERGLGRVSPRLGALTGRLGGTFVEGFRRLAEQPGAATGAALCTAGMWVVGVVAAWTAMQAFPGLGGGLGEATFSWATTIAAVTLVPTPGFFGAFEAGAAGSLVVLGHDADVARVYAFAYHLFSFGFAAANGLLFAVVSGIDVVGAVRRSRSPSGAAGTAEAGARVEGPPEDG
jgi:uncharacterized membrane protein YbhN (UPF0104 family)